MYSFYSVSIIRIVDDLEEPLNIKIMLRMYVCIIHIMYVFMYDDGKMHKPNPPSYYLILYVIIHSFSFS